MASTSAFCWKCGSPLPAGVQFCPACGTPVAQGPQPTAQPRVSGFDAVMKESAAQTYWVQRILAFVIDAVIVFVAVGILVALTALPFLILSGPGVFGAIFGGVFTFLSGVILVLYFTAAELLSGTSVGKRILGLKVTAAGGRLPNPGEALVRNLSKFYWILLLLDIVVGLATSKEYTQKYSDRLMGTSVVNA